MTRRDKIKNILAQLLPEHIQLFKRLYANGNLDKDINDVVNDMPTNKLNTALSQCQKTLNDRDKWLSKWRDYRIDEILKDDDTL